MVTDPSPLPQNPSEKSKQSPWSGATHGLQLGVTVLGGLALGHWLNRRYGWGAWGTLGGFFLGVVVGFANLIRAAK